MVRRLLVPNLRGPSEEWLSVRKGRHWLLMNAEDAPCAEHSSGYGAEVHQGSWMVDHARGFPLLAAWCISALVGLLGAMALAVL